MWTGHLRLAELCEEKCKLHMLVLWLRMVRNLRIPRVRALAFPLEMEIVVRTTQRKTAQTDFCLAVFAPNVFNTWIRNLIRVFMRHKCGYFTKIFR